MGKQVCACEHACHTITLLQIGGAGSDELAASPVGIWTVDAGPTCGAQCHPSWPSQQQSGGKGYPPSPSAVDSYSPQNHGLKERAGGLVMFCFPTWMVVARVVFHSN